MNPGIRHACSARVLSMLSIGLGSIACGGSTPPPAAPLAAEAPATAPDPAIDGALQAVVASLERPPAEVARDRWRHPRETLEFFGLRPDMTVVELWPGGGWYTAILAPF